MGQPERQKSIFSSSDDTVVLACRWSLLWILEVCGERGANLADLANCTKALDKAGDFFFWLPPSGHHDARRPSYGGPKSAYETALSTPQAMDWVAIVCFPGGRKRFFLTEKGSMVLNEDSNSEPWKDFIVKQFNLASRDQFEKIVRQNLT